MARIIKQRERVVTHHAYLRFDWADHPGCGFSFNMANGRVNVNNPRAWRNYQLCLQNRHFRREESPLGRGFLIVPAPVVKVGVEEWDSEWMEPALLQCDCGARVWLDHIMTNTCHQCGADYSLSGQKLAPRAQWGEETGESLHDIMSYNYDINTPVSEYAEVDY